MRKKSHLRLSSLSNFSIGLDEMLLRHIVVVVFFLKASVKFNLV